MNQAERPRTGSGFIPLLMYLASTEELCKVHFANQKANYTLICCASCAKKERLQMKIACDFTCVTQINSPCLLHVELFRCNIEYIFQWFVGFLALRKCLQNLETSVVRDESPSSQVEINSLSANYDIQEDRSMSCPNIRFSFCLQQSNGMAKELTQAQSYFLILYYDVLSERSHEIAL